MFARCGDQKRSCHENRMNVSHNDSRSSVRYEADEKPPMMLAFGLGLQFAILIAAGIVLTPAIVVRMGGGSEEFLNWTAFAAAAICGITTILQVVKVGRIGAGYVLGMGTSGAFIAICIAAIAKGGPAMLATLVATSALFQFALAARLSLFRRILTPTVAGTVIMLIPVTVMPIVFDMLHQVPEGSSATAAPVSALVTIFLIGAISLKSRGKWRLWAPVIGVLFGSLVGFHFGLYDVNRVASAAWVGYPHGGWPGFDLSFGPVFWTLLPGFIFVTLVGAVETIGDAVAIQRVSWRKPKAIDFKAVQGAVAADGVGNLLSGLAATVPNTTYSTSVAVTELTGVASRRVGIALGSIFIVVAFLPKILALVLAIPAPVASAYIMVLLSLLFVLGLKIVIDADIDYRRGMIVGISFWAGVGFQNGLIFPEFVTGFAGGLLENGMTAGGLIVITLTMLVELTEPRRRLETPFDIGELPKIREFLAKFAIRQGWGEEMQHRLDAVVEETMLTLLNQEGKREERKSPKRLMLTVQQDNGDALLEFIAATGEHNLEDQIALLGRISDEAAAERQLSLRLLRHLSSSVRHQQYHDADIVTVHVKRNFSKT